jgi:hypothetical protein
MHSKEVNTTKQSISIDPRLAAVIIAIVAYLAPDNIFLIPWTTLSIGGMAWDFSILSWELSILGPANWMQYPLVFIRFAFAYQIGMYYMARTSRRHTIMVGILSELPRGIFSILYLLQPLLAPWYLDLVIYCPLPLLLLSGVILMGIRVPPKRLVTWKGEQVISDSWLEI